MRRDLIASITALLAFTLLLGIVYPLAVTGISHVTMGNRAAGSTIKRDHKVVGSKLIAQAFDQPVLDANGSPTKDADGNAVREPNPAWFQPRPSQTGYNAAGSSFLNQGPNQQDLADTLKGYLDAYLALERPHNPSLTARQVPIDAVTNSASGIDPHISIANARIQAHRIAAERGASLRAVNRLIDQHVAGRALGLFGQAGVNVLELNLALDQEFPQR